MKTIVTIPIYAWVHVEIDLPVVMGESEEDRDDRAIDLAIDKFPGILNVTGDGHYTEFYGIKKPHRLEISEELDDMTGDFFVSIIDEE